jgi:hypothetical protein
MRSTFAVLAAGEDGEQRQHPVELRLLRLGQAGPPVPRERRGDPLRHVPRARPVPEPQEGLDVARPGRAVQVVQPLEPGDRGCATSPAAVAGARATTTGRVRVVTVGPPRQRAYQWQRGRRRKCYCWLCPPGAGRDRSGPTTSRVQTRRWMRIDPHAPSSTNSSGSSTAGQMSCGGRPPSAGRGQVVNRAGRCGLPCIIHRPRTRECGALPAPMPSVPISHCRGDSESTSSRAGPASGDRARRRTAASWSQCAPAEHSSGAPQSIRYLTTEPTASHLGIGT